MRGPTCTAISLSDQRTKPAINSKVIPKKNCASHAIFSERAVTNSKLLGGPSCDPSSSDCVACSMAASVESPSPIISPLCSTTFYSQDATDFSSPRFQSTWSNFSKLSKWSVEVDECIQYWRSMNDLNQRTSQNRGDNKFMMQNSCPKYISTEFESAMTATGPQLHGKTLSSVTAESVFEKTHKRLGTNKPEPNQTRQKPATRPKPLREFLDEAEEREIEVQIGAWKKGRYRELMNELRSKEAIIRAWEFKHTTKAMQDLQKLESKLQRQWALENDKVQRRVSRTKKEANKKVAQVQEKAKRQISQTRNEINMMAENVRESRGKKIRMAKASIKPQGTNNSIWLKLFKICM